MTPIWWIRHLPHDVKGRYIGQTDVPIEVPKFAANLPMQLPMNAAWFTTPMLRTIETAHWIMKSIGENTAPLNMAPELLEQHFGVWENKTYDEVWNASQQNWGAPELIKPEGGESFVDVCGRVSGWLNETLKTHAGQPIIIVGHAGSIRAGLAHALGVSPAQALAFGVDHGSMTQVEYYENEPLARVNYINR